YAVQYLWSTGDHAVNRLPPRLTTADRSAIRP
ncbi:MAG: hypothetical protein QOF38_3123, partial [Pseudonocardiales bacterium]|nr:hypothetical protein [Pseudonocardiales bacterium]